MDDKAKPNTKLLYRTDSDFESISTDELLNITFPAQPPVISSILPRGTFIFDGAPKIDRLNLAEQSSGQHKGFVCSVRKHSAIVGRRYHLMSPCNLYNVNDVASQIAALFSLLPSTIILSVDTIQH